MHIQSIQQVEPMKTLRVSNIGKRYGGHIALHNISFSASSGEIVAVCGENGAGKSTLMNILSGTKQPDAGDIYIDEKLTSIQTPHDAFDHGIHTVYQELSLLPGLSVTENILLGNLPQKGWSIDWKKAHFIASCYLEKLGFGDIDVRQSVQDLSVAFQQIVEITKALSYSPKLLILDEPTGVLTDQESKVLFNRMLKMRSEGGIILYISHRLEEVSEIADKIIVLKDGHKVDEIEQNDINIDRIVRSMVGRELKAIYPVPNEQFGNVVLKSEKLCGEQFCDISIDVREGEILGFFGLIGSGRTEFARALFGADPFTSGTIELSGKNFIPQKPRAAIQAGIAMVTEERKRDGLALGCDILDNGSLATLNQFSSAGIINNNKRKIAVENKVTKMSIKPHGLEHQVKNLSGGNQQKVVLAKWLLLNGLKVLILDEPTRGVDVGTKVEIYQLIIEVAKRGVAILLISSELPEILGLSNRVSIMREGEVVAILDRSECSEEIIFSYAAGVREDAQ